MKKLTLSLSIVYVLLLSCNNNKNIKGTEWAGIEDTASIYNVWMQFQDTTCLYVTQSKMTGYKDTTYLRYHINNDTISFIPFDEWVSVESNLLITDNGLIETKKNVLAFKKVSK